MRNTPWGLGVLLIPFLAAPAASQESRWERQVEARLVQSRTTLEKSGYTSLHMTWRGALANGDTVSIELPVIGVSSVAVLGVCDDDCRAFDLQLFAATGYEIDAAKETGATPIVRVTPRDSTRYRVRVRMTGCGMNPCWYGIAAFRRP